MPKLILFAGPNGCGKSTLYQTNRELFDIPRINVDEIVRERGGDWRNQSDLLNAGKIAYRKIRDCLNNRISFNRETTLCGKTSIRDIEEAKQLGYEIELHFVYVQSIDIAKERVHIRVENGGHGIPEADIERRYEESLRKLREILPLCDKVELYDNSEQFVKIMTIKKTRIVYKADPLPEWATTLS